MRRLHAALPVLAILLLLASSAWTSHRTTGSVHVHGYTTRSGHYVAPYTRSAPSTTRSTHTPSLHSHAPARTALGAPRDSHGRIKRSETAKRDFERHHACPSTGKTSGACPGYVVDHIVPLKRGAADAPNQHAVADQRGREGEGSVGVALGIPFSRSQTL